LGKDFPVYIDKDCLINMKKHRVKTISAENFTRIGFRGFEKNYQEEPSCLVLHTCLRKNINQFKVKLKSIYQNLVETTFDTNNYCRPTLVSWRVLVRDVILFLISLSRHLLCRPAQHTLIITCLICMLCIANHLGLHISEPLYEKWVGPYPCNHRSASVNGCS
jgi:hypothetical protein